MRCALLASLLLHGCVIAILSTALPPGPPEPLRPTLLLLPADSLPMTGVAATVAATDLPSVAPPAARRASPTDVNGAGRTRQSPATPPAATSMPASPKTPLPAAALGVEPAAPTVTAGTVALPEAVTKAANGAAGVQKEGSPAADKTAATGMAQPVRQGSERSQAVSARVISQPEPDYPALSREQAEEGVVKLRLALDAAGVLKSVSLLRSSGFVRLDKAARDGVWRWRFAPAISNGQSVPATLDVPVYFRLEQGG